MIVYGSAVSPFVRKVLVFIAEKGLMTEHLPLRFHDPSPEFQAVSPTGKIPGFSDGDYRLADSSAIVQYIERKYPNPSLLPQDAESLGRAIWFDEYADTILFGAAGTVFANLVVRPKVLGLPCDMAAVEKATSEELPVIYDYLQSQISGRYLVGEAFSLADIAVASPFVNLAMCGHKLDASKWPMLAAFVDGVLARDSFQKARDPKRG